MSENNCPYCKNTQDVSSDDRIIFICECHSYCHQAIFWYNKDDFRLYVTIHLITHKNFFKRLWTAVKYVFGYKSNFGDWDEFLFKSEDERKLRDYLKL